MKVPIVFKNGLYAGATLIGINLLMLLIVGTDPAYFDIAEVIGYTAIVLCLVFVFIGIRQYQIQNQSSGFIRRLGIGSGIALFPSLAFGIYNVIYVTWIDPEFTQKYMTHTLNKMQTTLSTEEFEMAKQQMIEQQEMFDNLPFQFLIMFVTVFAIGIVISIFSSIYFQFKPVKNE